ncbi:MAG: hypothetical protein ABSB70_18190 [Candidatus Velthaea sp.]
MKYQRTGHRAKRRSGICGTAAVVVGTVAILAPTSTAASSSAFLANSGVPVLLPAHTARLLGPGFHPYVMAAGRHGYLVAYTNVAHCTGGPTCAQIHIAGFVAGEVDGSTREMGTVIALPHHHWARYEPARCDISGPCREATLTFRHGDGWYELSAGNTHGDPAAFLRAMYCALRPLP